MYVSDLEEEFLEHLEVESGRSKRTIDNYRLYLDRLVEIGAETRASIINALAPLGIKLNADVNNAIASFKEITSGIITAEDSTVPVYVEPTNEEVMIIRDTYKFC